MQDLDAIIRQIVGNEKVQQSDAFQEKIYRDEPILFRASQLLRETPPAEEPTPDRIIAMRRLLYETEAQWKPREWVFCRQAEFMEHYTDSYTQPVRFDRYYPTYSDMTNAELRVYFTWRTAVREGRYPDTCLSFLFLYCYELINGIGFTDPREGFRLLQTLGQQYAERCPKLMRYLEKWLADFVLYYGLDPALAGEGLCLPEEAALLVLLHAEQAEDATLFAAMQKLSSYRIERSAFYKAYPAECTATACRLFRLLAAYYREHRKESLCEAYFGHCTAMTYAFFRGAVFGRKLPAQEIVLSEIHRYYPRGGIWYCERYFGKLGANARIGTLLRAVDAALRKQMHYPKPLTPPETTQLLDKMLCRAIEEQQAETRRRKAAAVKIDVSKLSGIRKAADITRDRLLVEEDAAEPVPETPPVPEPALPDTDTPLDPGEYRFMQALLYDGDWKAAAAACDMLPSVLADAVNEKLYDLFGDTVLEFPEDAPALIEDYIEDLKGMIHP